VNINVSTNIHTHFFVLFSLCQLTKANVFVTRNEPPILQNVFVRLRLKCDGTRAETTFRFSAKRTSPFKSAGASIQSTTGSRGVRISSSNAGCTMFRGNVKSTDYPLHSPVSSSLPFPCVTVCHHISAGPYRTIGALCLFAIQFSVLTG